jgi:hypothetical protein
MLESIDQELPEYIKASLEPISDLDIHYVAIRRALKSKSLRPVLEQKKARAEQAVKGSQAQIESNKEMLVNLEGPIRRTREGGSEWEPIKILLEGDGNSNKMNTASNTHLRLTTQVGQAHVATGVPLDLGTNTQPSDLRTQRNTKPRVFRPTPVRPVSTTGQSGPCW